MGIYPPSTVAAAAAGDIVESLHGVSIGAWSTTTY